MGPAQASKGVDSLFTIGTDSTDLLYDVSDISVHCKRDCFLYVLDGGIYQVKKYSRDGRLIAEAGAKGVGPGKFKNPFDLSLTDEIVLVTEQTTPRSHVFDHDLTHKKDVVLDLIPFRTSGRGHDTIVMSGLPVQPTTELSSFLTFKTTNYEAHSIDVPSPPIPDQIERATEENPMLEGVWRGGIVHAHDDMTVVAFIYTNRVVAVREDEVLWTHALDELPEVTQVERRSGRPMPSQKLLTGLTTDAKGNTYVLASAGEAPNRTIYVLNEAGVLQRELLLPYEAHSITWSPPSRIFVEEGEGTRIGAYKITSAK